MARWIIAIGVGLVVLSQMFLAVPELFAQAPGGAFEQLSPGNQKIARSLFEAQPAQPPAGTRRLTLDEIAARKQARGGGWGRVFDGMRAEGLTTTKNLGQSVSSYNHRHHVSTGAVTTAANRTVSSGVNNGNAGRHTAVNGNGHHERTGVTARGTTSAGGAQANGSAAAARGHGGGRGK